MCIQIQLLRGKICWCRSYMKKFWIIINKETPFQKYLTQILKNINSTVIHLSNKLFFMCCGQRKQEYFQLKVIPKRNCYLHQILKNREEIKQQNRACTMYRCITMLKCPSEDINQFLDKPFVLTEGQWTKFTGHKPL